MDEIKRMIQDAKMEEDEGNATIYQLLDIMQKLNDKIISLERQVINP